MNGLPEVCDEQVLIMLGVLLLGAKQPRVLPMDRQNDTGLHPRQRS